MFKQLSVLALASRALAQNTPTLQEALSSSPDLSQLTSVLGLSPGLIGALSNAHDITILAPSNAAFARVGNATLTSLASNVDLLTAILQYHVVNGTVYGSQITNTSAFVPTLLTNPLFTNVTGGQRVKAQLNDGNVTFFSGLQETSIVTKADVNFTGGVIHFIDSLLTLPESADETLSAAGLTSLRGALEATELLSTVNNTPNITIFAPNNAAFQAIGSGLGNLTAEQITDILTYHAVIGSEPGYSSGLENGTTLTAVNGDELTITINDGRVFVNNARVIIPDVLIANGVVHVIDAVLNPSNATIADPTATAGDAAFSGASSVSDAPYTSGQPTASKTIAPEATTPAASSSGGVVSASVAGAAQAIQTGAIGMGALLGAAAVYFV